MVFYRLNQHVKLVSIATEEMDTLIRSGFTKPVRNITLSDKVDLIQTLSLQSVILDSLGELTQFKDGINSLGVGEALGNFQAIMRCFYCTDSKTKIGAGIYTCMYMYMQGNINNVRLE